MKVVAAVVPDVAVGYFIGIRSETPWFAPKAKDFVSVASSRVTLPSGPSLTAFKVPADRSFVLTGINVQQTGGTTSITALQMYERDLVGTMRLRVPESILSSLYLYDDEQRDGHGLAFAPTTEVAFHLPSTTSSGTLDFVYLLNGYLAEK